jgi:hypothetical protein
MIGGRFVLRERKLVNVNLEQLRRRADEAVERLLAANAETRALAEKLHPYVGQFCGGLV